MDSERFNMSNDNAKKAIDSYIKSTLEVGGSCVNVRSVFLDSMRN